MTQSAPLYPIDQIQACLSLASDLSRHSEANQSFVELQTQLANDNPQAAEMLGVLWNEILTVRRSATFWEQISNVERKISEDMAANHFRLQQNYLRLIQEQ
jgi:hypothetical protein